MLIMPYFYVEEILKPTNSGFEHKKNQTKGNGNNKKGYGWYLNAY